MTTGKHFNDHAAHNTAYKNIGIAVVHGLVLHPKTKRLIKKNRQLAPISTSVNTIPLKKSSIVKKKY